MLKKLMPLCCLAGILIISGCSSAYTGIDGDTMYTNTFIDTAITPVNGMKPLKVVKTAIDIPTDTNLPGRANMYYAIYGDPDQTEVKRHGHVIFTSFTSKRAYTFNPETFPKSNEFALASVKEGDKAMWREHAFYEPAEGDWFSKVLVANDRIVPKVWIGKRWTRSQTQYNRIVIEYREPLPSCAKLDSAMLVNVFQSTNIYTPTEQCRAEVDAVWQRADESFKVQSAKKEFVPSNIVPENVLVNTPKGAMDAERHIGTATLNTPTWNVD